MPGLTALVTLAIAATFPSVPGVVDRVSPSLENAPVERHYDQVVRPRPRARRERPKRCYVGETLCGVRCSQFVERTPNPRECDRYPPRTPRIIPPR